LGLAAWLRVLDVCLVCARWLRCQLSSERAAFYRPHR